MSTYYYISADISRSNSLDSTSVNGFLSPSGNSASRGGGSSSVRQSKTKRTKRMPDFIDSLDLVHDSYCNMVGDLSDIVKASNASNEMASVSSALTSALQQRALAASQNPPNTALLAVLDQQIADLATRQGNLIGGTGGGGGGFTGSGGGGGLGPASGSGGGGGSVIHLA